MKKILLMIAMFMMVGCSQNKQLESTIMVTKNNVSYALYNQDGKQLTEYNYKTYQEIENLGYIVTNDKDQLGFVTNEGEETIAFGSYETLEVVDQMFYATKKVEVKEEKKEDKKETKDKKKETKKEKGEALQNTDGFIQDNLYVLNSQGQVLYSADQATAIKKSGLPIIRKDKTYTVLSKDGQELYKGEQEVKYAYQKDGSSYIVGLSDHEKFSTDLKGEGVENVKLDIKELGTFEILLQNQDGSVLYDKTLKQMIYVDYKNKSYKLTSIALTGAEFDDAGHMILCNNQYRYLYQVGKDPIFISSYYVDSSTYVSRSQVVYGPHTLYKDGKKSGELENCQLYPTSKMISSEIFPVYQRNKGYEYYNFDGKKVIDKTYLAAEPFDMNSRAIVKEKEDGYSLIDESGVVLTKFAYTQMKYIGSSYYAVYNKTGMFGIIDKDGTEVFEIGYTTLPEKPIITYDNEPYMILIKNGRTYIYDIKDDMNVIFSKEGNVTFDEKGYFITDKEYYTFEGELIE